MIEPKKFFDLAIEKGIDFFTGVPDSLLAEFCAHVDDVGGRARNIIAANEGNAIGIAIGYHMSTGKAAMVYMQNSGLGNAVNPLVSLADPEVYKIPMMLLIGWRGEPGVLDEPQHIKQGRITLDQLRIMEIPYWVIDSASDISSVMNTACNNMYERGAAVALVVRKNTFAQYKSVKSKRQLSAFVREHALEKILQLAKESDIIVSTTGKTSREVYEIRQKHNQTKSDFLTVGGMGHTASIALGIAIGKHERRIICLDGDGSILMHMGSLPVIAGYKPNNFIHIVLNNGAHESVGGQSTVAANIDFDSLSKAIGYVGYAMANDHSTLDVAWEKLTNIKGPTLLEIKLKTGSRENLGRPEITPENNKLAFMRDMDK